MLKLSTRSVLRKLLATGALSLSVTGCVLDELVRADSPSLPESSRGTNDLGVGTPPPSAVTDERALSSLAGGGEGVRNVPPARDLWEQIRLSSKVVPVRPEVSSLQTFRREQYRFHGHQRFFDHLSERARPWLYHVAEGLADRGLPGELALLPAVESNYNSLAVSPSGASGLWQLLPATAQELRLATSWWYDSRHDVVAATRAALDYLEYLNKEFRGDWLLTVAAYNCGPGNVQRAMKKARVGLESATYPTIEPYLPRETRNHVARWLVLSEVIARPRLHKIQLQDIPLEPYFAEVPTKRQMEFAEAAKLAGVPLAEVRRLNPGLRRDATAPNSPHRLLLPVDNALRFRRGLVQAPSEPLATAGAWRQHHRIQPGDTLWDLARAYGRTVREFMRFNRLDSDVLRPGDKLLIPPPRETRPSGGGAKSDIATTHVLTGEPLALNTRQYSEPHRYAAKLESAGTDANLLQPGREPRIRRQG